MLKQSTKQYIAVFYLILMCVQFIPLEGMGVSYFKFGAMCLSPLILLITSLKVTKVWLWIGLYCLFVTFSALFDPAAFRFSSIGYLYTFLVMFLLFNNLISCEKVFTPDFYIRLLKGLIFAYVIVLLLQQAAILIGFKQVPVINLMYSLNRTIWGNSLALEPSHAARILGAAFLAFLKTNEIKNGVPLKLKELFGKYKWLTLGFLYAMFTMGSGTAFVALAIISLYFLRKQYIAFIVPLLFVLYLLVPVINYEPLNRAATAIEVLLSEDPNRIVKEDMSAAVRIKPLINTFTNLDLTDKTTWLGEGTDASLNYGVHSRDFDKQMMGGINNYGLIGFILGVILIGTCCLTRFFSLETLFIFILVGFAINNIAYIWGIYMLFVPVKYFYKNYVYANGDMNLKLG